MIGKQELKDAVTNVRGNRLSRMHTCSDEDIRLVDIMVFIIKINTWVLLCNCKQIDSVAGRSAAERRPMAESA